MSGTRDHFFACADALAGMLGCGEDFLLAWEGEDSDFARLNAARIRQAGAVRQRTVTLELLVGQRAAAGSVELGGVPDLDRARLGELLAELRGLLPHLPPDPHLLCGRAALRLERLEPGLLPDAGQAVEGLIALAGGTDLVGLWSSGVVERGFASSFGARCWHALGSFHLDASLHLADGRSVKWSYAGSAWDEEELAQRVTAARRQLAILARPLRTVPPGAYRTYLAPEALKDVIDMMTWGGFSCKARRTRTSPLLSFEEGARLSPLMTLDEDHAGGQAPAFTSRGFAKPGRVGLIHAGALGDPLISARSAQEFSLTPNCGDEQPESLTLAAGGLPTREVLARLGTGLWLGNLWYCNFSDRSACRITGMTRFACFWVEGGEIVAPIAALRFDDTVQRILGTNLAALTVEREVLPDRDTYGGRSTRTTVLPGALLEELVYTL